MYERLSQSGATEIERIESAGVRVASLAGTSNPDLRIAVDPGFTSGLAAGVVKLAASSGRKLAQQIARFRAAGGVGGREEFLRTVEALALRARESGNFVTGTGGRGPQSIPNATIFREGSTFVVVDGAGVVRSFVPNASAGGNRG